MDKQQIDEANIIFIEVMNKMLENKTMDEDEISVHDEITVDKITVDKINVEDQQKYLCFNKNACICIPCAACDDFLTETGFGMFLTSIIKCPFECCFHLFTCCCFIYSYRIETEYDKYTDQDNNSI
jgi:hypothetical protein